LLTAGLPDSKTARTVSGALVLGRGVPKGKAESSSSCPEASVTMISAPGYDFRASTA